MSSPHTTIQKHVRRTLYLAAAAVFMLLPRLSHACAVCSTGREDENADAFLAMTVFMTSTPLLILGGAIWWFVRRTLQREREVEEAREAAASGAQGSAAQPSFGATAQARS
jgi:hypothetical protein